MAEFVNPYTFVPLGGTVRRGNSAGHAQLAQDGLSGQLEVSVTARTPLLVGGFGVVPEDQLTPSEGDGSVQDLPRRRDGTVVIPGAGFAGAVRSTHEALAGGCLRVVDEEFVPVHRHVANASVTRGLDLAVVLKVDETTGKPVEMALASEVAWIPLEMLGGGGARIPHTGDRITIGNMRVGDARDRSVLVEGDISHRSGLSPNLDGSWVLLVTDTRARNRQHPVYFAAARMGPDSPIVRVGDQAWATYLSCVDGSDDLRLFRQDDPPAQSPGAVGFIDVHWPPPGPRRMAAVPAVGRRLPARPYLLKGQPVFVRTSGAEVTEIRLSQLWRYLGGGTVGERIGESHPCAYPAALCPSCQLFGSVDPHAREEDEVGRQRSYRGHVRFDELMAVGTVDGVAWHLAPLSSPRPSAGQFYLDHGRVPKKIAERDTPPAATWGSIADSGGLRPVRGRKFYWRTAGPDQPQPERRGAWPRGQARPHHSEQLTRRVRLMPDGTRLVGRVCFENLTAAQVGALLAALDPRLVFRAGEADDMADGSADVVTSLGGGKPFGFGAVTVDVRLVRLDSAGSRYLGQQPPPREIADLVKDFVDTADHTGWPALRAALTFGRVPNDSVWYPPGPGEPGDESFDRGFEFWQRSAGSTMSREIRPLVELPPVTAPTQQLDSAVETTPAPDGGRGGRRQGNRR